MGVFTTIWNGLLCFVSFNSKPYVFSEPRYFDLLWDYRMIVLRDVMLLLAAIFVIYCAYKTIKRLNTFEQNDKGTEIDSKSPCVYNINNNIHIWLNQMEEYLDTKQITSDKDKQKVLLDKLDRTSRKLINELIKAKRIKSYQEMEDHLKSLYGPSNISTNDYILEFTQFKQNSNDSLAQYYKNLTELAKNAYPYTPTDVVESYITKQFILGLNNCTIRDQLLLQENKNEPNTAILTKAVELQNKLACIPKSEHGTHHNANSVISQRNNQNDFRSNNSGRSYSQPNTIYYDTTQPSNSDTNTRQNGNSRYNNRNYYNTNNNQPQSQRNQYSQNVNNTNNSTRSTPSNNSKKRNGNVTCYKCNQVGHISSNCPNGQNQISSASTRQ